MKGSIVWAALVGVGAYLLATKVLAAGTSNLQAFAQAIAYAEGAIDINGNLIMAHLAAQRNNPGDLEEGNGDAVSPVTYFPTLAAGWAALYAQLGLVQQGRAYENYNGTIPDFAVTWTGNDDPTDWATNVIYYLNAYQVIDSTGLAIDQNTLINQIF